MKIITTLHPIALVFIGLFFTHCDSPAELIVAENFPKREVKELVVHQSEIATAQKDTYSDYQKFLKDAYSKLDKNETAIVKINHDSNLVLENSLRTNVSEIEDLKISHNTLKCELDDYVKNGTGNWQTYKTEFYCEFDQLEIACNTTSNKYNNLNQ